MSITFGTTDWLVVILVLAFFVTFFISYKTFSPWVPTNKKDWHRIFDIADFKDGDVFYDLGCGAGALVFEVSRRFNIKVVGIEISWPMYLTCLVRKIFHPREKLAFKKADYFQTDLSEASVVYFFGIPTNLQNNDLVEKFKKELKPGTRIISYAFGIPGWRPAKIDRGDGHKDVPIMLYTI